MAHLPSFSQSLQFFVVPRGEYDPPLLELRLLEADGVGDLKPADDGVRDLDCGLEKDLTLFVTVVLLAWFDELRCGERPLSKDRGRSGANRRSDECPLRGPLPVREPKLFTDPPLESLERYEFPPVDLDLGESRLTFQPRILFGRCLSLLGLGPCPGRGLRLPLCAARIRG